jgi:hypothetical protein
MHSITRVTLRKERLSISAGENRYLFRQLFAKKKEEWFELHRQNPVGKSMPLSYRSVRIIVTTIGVAPDSA